MLNKIFEWCVSIALILTFLGMLILTFFIMKPIVLDSVVELRTEKYADFNVTESTYYENIKTCRIVFSFRPERVNVLVTVGNKRNYMKSFSHFDYTIFTPVTKDECDAVTFKEF